MTFPNQKDVKWALYNLLYTASGDNNNYIVIYLWLIDHYQYYMEYFLWILKNRFSVLPA